MVAIVPVIGTGEKVGGDDDEVAGEVAEEVVTPIIVPIIIINRHIIDIDIFDSNNEDFTLVNQEIDKFVLDDAMLTEDGDVGSTVLLTMN